MQPETIEEARYPTALIETKAIREDRRSDHVIAVRLERILAVEVEDAGEQARLRRMLAYWADPTRADTTQEDEELAFAGAKRSLFEAFGLPWLGASEAGADAASAVQHPDPSPEPDAQTILLVDEDDGETTAPDTRRAWARGAPIAPRAPVIPPKPKRLTASRTELENAQHQLRNWVKGGAISNPSGWNKLLYEIIRSVDPRRLGLSPYLFDKIVTPEMVKLQGSTTGSRSYLTVASERWVRDGLEAYLALKLDKGMSRDDAAFHRQNLAILMRRLERLVSDYVDTRMPRDEHGKRWSPVAGIAQVLVARAWLRGTILAQASVDAVELLVGAKVLAELDDSIIQAIWPEPHIDRVVALDLLNRITAALREDPAPEGSVRLSRALCVCSGSEKPWPTIVDGVLRGGLTLHRPNDQRFDVRTCLISPLDAEVLRGMRCSIIFPNTRSEWLSEADAKERLSISGQRLRSLVTAGKLSRSGTYTGQTYRRSEVNVIACEFVSAMELQAKLSLGRRELSSLLNATGLMVDEHGMIVRWSAAQKLGLSL